MFPLTCTHFRKHIHSVYILVVLREGNTYIPGPYLEKNYWGANTYRVAEGQSGTYISLITTYRDTGQYLGGGGGGVGA